MDSTPLTLLTPFAAAIHGKDAIAQAEFWKRLAAQPLPIREFMTSPDTAQAIHTLVTQGSIPESHGIAVARLVALIALNEVEPSQATQLMEKIGIPNAAVAAQSLGMIVLSLLEAARERVRKYPGLAHPESAAVSATSPIPVPPLMIRRPVVGPPPRPPAIIDLRKQQP